MTSLSRFGNQKFGLARDGQHISDFTRWKEHNAYTKALDRLLRDLRVEKVSAGEYALCQI
jgi:hypothetical protein